MRKKIFPVILSALLSVSLLGSCDKNGSGNTEPVKQRDSVLVTGFADAEYVFGFAGQKRYSYCPSVLIQDDGSSHIFFCGNPNQGIMVDNIYHFTLSESGSKTSPKSVLQPGLDWDSHHTCDPCVIQGEFGMGGETYTYAMFFLSNPNEYYYNEIGVAFSNSLDASQWVKYPVQLIHKTWAQEGDQSLGGSSKSWGVGQPSAVSLDMKGKVLLTYTIGDSAGTRVVFSEIDLSDMDAYTEKSGTTMSVAGLLNLDGSQDYSCNADFAVNIEANKIVMTRPLHPHPSGYPSYIPVAEEVDWMDLDAFLAGRGSWTRLGIIDSSVSGFARNHNSCIARDNYGHIEDWENPTVYFAVSKEAPEVAAATDTHAEWTYHIYRTTFTRYYRYFYR